MDGEEKSFIADFVRETYLSFTEHDRKHGSEKRKSRSVLGAGESTTGTDPSRHDHGSAERAVV